MVRFAVFALHLENGFADEMECCVGTTLGGMFGCLSAFEDSLAGTSPPLLPISSHLSSNLSSRVLI